MNVYFISGLGANQKAFENFVLPEGYKFLFIDWKQPLKNETLPNYCKRMSEEIDTSKPFILVGYSFGGIVSQEINRFMKPEKTIIIASAKKKEEMCLMFKISSLTSFHKIVPSSLFTNEYFLSYKFFRNIYYIRDKATNFFDYYVHRDPYYLRWSFNKIVNWKPTVKVENLYHIHGAQDVVFPNVKVTENVRVIENGTHLMPMYRTKTVNKILNDILTR
ncbi:MAG: alpha/beta fold hydrolase [Flavobacteriales bacterium]